MGVQSLADKMVLRSQSAGDDQRRYAPIPNHRNPQLRTMKFLVSKKSSSAGHILLLTIVITAIIGIALFAHLNVISSQNNFTVRSQVWNLCMPVIEAGLEEALAHANNLTTSNLATQNWTWDATANV